MSFKLTVHPTDVRLVPSDIDMAVGGSPPNLERVAKLVKEAYLRNNDEAGFYQAIGVPIPASVAPRDHAQMRDMSASGQAQSGPGVQAPGFEALPQPKGNIPVPPGQQMPGNVPTNSTNPQAIPVQPQPPQAPTPPPPGIHPPAAQPVFAPPPPAPQQPNNTGFPPGYVAGGTP